MSSASATRPAAPGFWTLRRRRNLIRLGFLVLPFVLVAQMVVAFRWTEPFPAIMMPRFTYQTITQGEVVWRDVRIEVQFADGGLEAVDKHDLLESMHLPQRNKVLFRVFDTDSPSPAHPSVVRWLARRAGELTGRQDARLMRFHWWEMIADFSTGEQGAPRRKLGTYVVALAEAAQHTPGEP